MDNSTPKYVPQMRTASGIVATLKELDPGTDVTVNLVRQIIKDDYRFQAKQNATLRSKHMVAGKAYLKLDEGWVFENWGL